VSRVAILVGPTAVGKSGVALAAARRTGAEIVNADALQVYRGFDVGTAKPSPAERREVPHHLVDVLEPSERFSAGEFARRARAELDRIAGRGRPAIVVGGSGFYVHALASGLAQIPASDPEVRRELRQRLEEEGLRALRGELERLDPVTARRLGEGDTQRILRALEVAIGTGRPLSAWIGDPAAVPELDAAWIGLTLSRADLYDRIEARIHDMLERGWLAEVGRLVAGGLPREAPAMQAIGYADWALHLDGALEFEEALTRVIRATRRYAKRQETWFRREARVEWVPADPVEPAIERLVEVLTHEPEER